MDGLEQLCRICEVAKRKYVCPKCGIPYCSLKCYRDLVKHFNCSETFYRECVEEELREEKDPTKAKKMGEILQRFNEEYNREEEDFDDGDDIDSDDDEPLHARMEGINLDDPEQIWNSLTREEREGFKDFVENNETCTTTASEWIPWWKCPIKKVQELPEDEILASCSSTLLTSSGGISKLNAEQPDILVSIPSMSTLTKITPGNSVKYGLVNVVGAYVWTARLYGGGVLEVSNQQEIGFSFVSLSSFLNSDQVFTSFRDAVTDITFNASKIPELLDGGTGLHASLEKDVYSLLTGGLQAPLPVLFSSKKLSKSFVLSALSECHRLMSSVVAEGRKATAKTKTLFKKGGDTDKCPKLPPKDSESFGKLFATNQQYKLDSKTASKALRKLYYLLAFANEFEIL